MAPEPDRPLRILRVVHTLRREAGGPSESVVRSSAALGARGHEIAVATADAPGTPPPPATGFAFHPLGGFNRPVFQSWLQRERTRFDAVLVHGLWQAGWAVRQALAGTRTPYLVFPHGMLDPWFARAYPLKHVKKQLYWWWREGRVLRDAAAVCFTCEAERRLAQKTFTPYSANERVVAYGTAKPPANHEALRAAFISRFPALTSRPFILFLSRIHAKKGVHELISGYAKFRQTHRDTPGLVIAGPCEDADLLQDLQRHAGLAGLSQLELLENPAPVLTPADITWLPMLGDDLKWGAMLSAEAFILPSHQENFGIAVAEALACGRPVLISDKVNIWREIDAARAGLVAADTAAGVENLLTRWSDLTPAERHAMGAAAARCFAANFEITNAAKSLAGVIRECVAD
jgi:glycosyltransferase involved in cell wall biosynthesis